MAWVTADGQDQTPAPITQVVPVASPTASPAAAKPVANSSPTATPEVPSPSATVAPEVPSPSPGATPTPAMSGTASTGTSAVVSGTTVVPSPTPASPYSIEIDLGKQRAYLLKDGTTIAQAAVSSGRPGHLTPTGNFAVIEKDLNHFSNLYGKIVEKDSGRVVKSGADVATPIPKGCKFEPAPMKWFMRFEGASGMHAGILPGYPASHGCVRMPASKAQLFYQAVVVGTPVHVFGTPPERSAREEAPHHHAVVVAHASPVPTPKAKHGWWLF